MKMKRIAAVLLVLLVPFLTFAGGQGGSAEAQSPEEFYNTHNVTLIANGGVGGGTDFAARLFASYWSEVTDGAMVVKVMSGGGGIEGLNAVYRAKPDGLTIGNTHHPSDMTSPKLLGTPGPKFDTRELSWIGFFGFDPKYMWIDANAPPVNAEDLRNAGKLVFGAASPASTGTVATIVAIDILGLDADVIFGYEAPELGLAVKRGEIVGYTLEASSGSVEVERGYVKPFCSMTFDRTPWYPDAPSLAEIAGDLTPDQQDMIRFVEALVDGKSFFGPPGIPADRLEYLRRSFDAIMEHPGFVKQAKVRWAIWQKPLTGEQLEKEVRAVLSMPDEKIAATRNLVNKYIK
jgi:tripartite-type tricarboxylate transporter receptor subunit TctC